MLGSNYKSRVISPRKTGLYWALVFTKCLLRTNTNGTNVSLPFVLDLPCLIFPSDISLSFPEEMDADYVLQTLTVDDELQPEKIHRTHRDPCVCRPNNLSHLIILLPVIMHMKLFFLRVVSCSHFAATEIRLLRAAVSSFYDMSVLAARTLLEFKE
ncbi:hypothetical protein PsorP6_003853 [Peronosclerospora sorghi]|uniref:Uncharacterized protein n=1 Tax=Peronosclerospora sorghi TaxID=230839 RepID=A0ACC0VPM2_9STRA|nr:hypothetical protein PsorP6_003853 [Peronosclerospora sorghi]